MNKLALVFLSALAFAVSAFAANPPDTSTSTNVGHQVTLTVTVNADPNMALPLSYQWKKDGLAIAAPTGTAEPCVITNLQTTDSGRYTVTVSNSVGSVDSLNGAVLTVTPAPTPPSGAVVQQPVVK